MPRVPHSSVSSVGFLWVPSPDRGLVGTLWASRPAQAGFAPALLQNSARRRGWGSTSLGDDGFRAMVLARIVEPTSKAEVVRVLDEIGAPAVSLRTLFRSLARSQARDYRGQLATTAWAHSVRASGTAALVLHDVTTLHFERSDEDELRKVGMSKEHRADPQVQAGLLADPGGFPLEVHLFEGNKAETTTLIPVLSTFAQRHGVPDMVVGADAGMLSAANLNARPRDLASQFLQIRYVFRAARDSAALWTRAGTVLPPYGGSHADCASAFAAEDLLVDHVAYPRADGCPVFSCKLLDSLDDCSAEPNWHMRSQPWSLAGPFAAASRQPPILGFLVVRCSCVVPILDGRLVDADGPTEPRIPVVRRRDGDTDHQPWNHAYHQPVSGTILVGRVEDWISVDVSVQDVLWTNCHGPALVILWKMLHQMYPVAIVNLERAFGIE